MECCHSPSQQPICSSLIIPEEVKTLSIAQRGPLGQAHLLPLDKSVTAGKEMANIFGCKFKICQHHSVVTRQHVCLPIQRFWVRVLAQALPCVVCKLSLCRHGFSLATSSHISKTFMASKLSIGVDANVNGFLTGVHHFYLLPIVSSDRHNVQKIGRW